MPLATMSAGGPAGVRGRGRGRITPGFRFCVPSEGTEAKGAHNVHGKPASGVPGDSCGHLRGGFRLLPEKFQKNRVRCHVQRGPCGTLYAVTDIFDHNSAGPDGVANRAPIRHTENTMRTGAANPVNFDRVDDEGRGVTELMTPGGMRCHGTLTKRTSWPVSSTGQG